MKRLDPRLVARAWSIATLIALSAGSPAVAEDPADSPRAAEEIAINAERAKAATKTTDRS